MSLDGGSVHDVAGDGGGSIGGGGSGEGAGGGSWPPATERLAAVVERLRQRPRVEYPPVSPRRAAVLVGLFEDRRGVVRVLLTQRSSRLKSHRGEVCLPGGKRDEGDVDDAATALREAQEELGLDPSSVTVLGSMPPVLSKHHLSVTPVLALVPPDLVPAPNPHEVAAAFTVPLAVFLGQLSGPRVGGDGGGGGGGGGARGRAQLDADGAGGGQHGRRTRRRTAADGAAAAVAATATKAAAAASPPWLGPLSWRAADEGAAATATVGSGAEPPRDRGPSIGVEQEYGAAEHEFRDIRWDEHSYRIHYFQYGEFNVWGLTATICIAAAQLALGRPPCFEERCPGGHHYSCFYWDGTALRVRPAGVDAREPSGSLGAGGAVAAVGTAGGPAARVLPVAAAVGPDCIGEDADCSGAR